MKNQGNLKSLQTEQGISYPAAKKKLNDLLVAMNLVDNVQPYSVEDIDTSTWKIDPKSSKASDIVKERLLETIKDSSLKENLKECIQNILSEEQNRIYTILNQA